MQRAGVSHSEKAKARGNTLSSPMLRSGASMRAAAAAAIRSFFSAVDSSCSCICRSSAAAAALRAEAAAGRSAASAAAALASRLRLLALSLGAAAAPGSLGAFLYSQSPSMFREGNVSVSSAGVASACTCCWCQRRVAARSRAAPARGVRARRRRGDQPPATPASLLPRAALARTPPPCPPPWRLPLRDAWRACQTDTGVRQGSAGGPGRGTHGASSASVVVDFRNAEARCCLTNATSSSDRSLSATSGTGTAGTPALACPRLPGTSFPISTTEARRRAPQNILCVSPTDDDRRLTEEERRIRRASSTTKKDARCSVLDCAAHDGMSPLQ